MEENWDLIPPSEEELAVPLGCKFVLPLLLLLEIPKLEPLKIFENHGEEGLDEGLKARKTVRATNTAINT